MSISDLVTAIALAACWGTVIAVWCAGAVYNLGAPRDPIRDRSRNGAFLGATPIFDPLVLFEVLAMDCQKDSRLIADLYAAAGYQSRSVDLYGHTVAEVSYDGGWHNADADMFGGRRVATMPDGHIRSVAELSRQRALLDRISVYLENDVLVSYRGRSARTGRRWRGRIPRTRTSAPSTSPGIRATPPTSRGRRFGLPVPGRSAGARCRWAAEGPSTSS